ncbi:MAG: hypothetical protein BWY67_01058 [Bacteroidetes bacterium ADurb.Bin397]|nr:MAG: hypothetical protein BWY67_01058 [Bacteroidetes bacterium ADurb.Bin397]
MYLRLYPEPGWYLPVWSISAIFQLPCAPPYFGLLFLQLHMRCGFTFSPHCRSFTVWEKLSVTNRQPELLGNIFQMCRISYLIHCNLKLKPIIKQMQVSYCWQVLNRKPKNCVWFHLLLLLI